MNMPRYKNIRIGTGLDVHRDPMPLHSLAVSQETLVDLVGKDKYVREASKQIDRQGERHHETHRFVRPLTLNSHQLSHRNENGGACKKTDS